MANGAPLEFNKVLALPGVLTPDAIYFVHEAAGRMSIVVAGADGTPYSTEQPMPLDFSFGSRSKPAADAEFGRFLVTQTIDLDASRSAMVAAIGPTSALDVLVTRLGGDIVAKFHFAAGAQAASVDVLVPTVSPGDVLLFKAPAVQDATLSGINGTLAGLRRTG